MSFGLGAESNECDIALGVSVLFRAHLVDLSVVVRDIGWRGLEGHLLADEAEDALFPSGTLLGWDKSVDHVGTATLGIELP